MGGPRCRRYRHLVGGTTVSGQRSVEQLVAALDASVTAAKAARDEKLRLDQTVLEAVLDASGCREQIAALGLHPDMTVRRLQADLAIAQRARETERHGSPVGDWNLCLDHILGDES